MGLKGTQLYEFLDSEVEAPAQYIVVADNKKTKMPNPKFAIYFAKQNQVLNFLLSSLSKEMHEFASSYTTP
jgi:hypothetical protein